MTVGCIGGAETYSNPKVSPLKVKLISSEKVWKQSPPLAKRERLVQKVHIKTHLFLTTTVESVEEKFSSVQDCL